MSQKNYYKILQVSDSATPLEIKKAYRKLAHKYHPDKNQNDSFADFHFKEIQEAYYTLSDAQRRSTYNQKRWYSKHQIRSQFQEPVTSVTILDKLRELRKYVSKLDRERINKKALYNYINYILSGNAIHLLDQTIEQSIKIEIIETLLHIIRPLRVKDAIMISNKLKLIAAGDQDLLLDIEKSVREMKTHAAWERYQFFVIFVVTIFLCWLIYKIS